MELALLNSKRCTAASYSRRFRWKPTRRPRNGRFGSETSDLRRLLRPCTSRAPVSGTVSQRSSNFRGKNQSWKDRREISKSSPLLSCLEDMYRLGFSIWRVLILLQFLPGILSWGKEGHYATCKIAEGLLTEEAIASVRMLLPDYANGDLAAVCSWPDEIRHNFKWRWTGPLHYVDTLDFKCNYDYARDCHNFAGKKHMCVAGAIYNYSGQLSAYQHPDSEQKYNFTEALLFLSHFMGDIHQPLHVGFTGDEGGNTIKVHWYRRKTNLHHVWDDMIIDTALKKFYNLDIAMMVQGIQTNILEDWSTDVPSWENCKFNQTVCPNMYASESISFACKFAYRNATPGSTLGDEYFLTRLPLVEKRLAQGGVRLAATLNRIFHPTPSIAISAAQAETGAERLAFI